MIVATVATAATDAALRRRFRALGAAAHRAGASRDCRYDHRSMIAAFWFEGWDLQAEQHGNPPPEAEPEAADDELS